MKLAQAGGAYATKHTCQVTMQPTSFQVPAKLALSEEGTRGISFKESDTMPAVIAGGINST
jgi:hypothetical protein